jgi:hypothetical protein
MKRQRSDRFSAALCGSDVCEGPDVLVEGGCEQLCLLVYDAM